MVKERVVFVPRQLQVRPASPIRRTHRATLGPELVVALAWVVVARLGDAVAHVACPMLQKRSGEMVEEGEEMRTLGEP